jgi:hypothetical protein
LPGKARVSASTVSSEKKYLGQVRHLKYMSPPGVGPE